MTEADELLRRQLGACAAIYHDDPRLKYPMKYHLILEFGLICTPAVYPSTWAAGRPGMCYANAATLAKRRDLTYVEGFALLASGMPIDHAWCGDFSPRVCQSNGSVSLSALSQIRW
ncbi:hypothetical protein [Streptosporangium sp. H16]|uniref:hypothetical protein n=1 Tax=Streptosporangium sp. H16 TaxID=3444184 RepID=UPI003F7A2B5D